jgi:hypothetical protein
MTLEQEEKYWQQLIAEVKKYLETGLTRTMVENRLKKQVITVLQADWDKQQHENLIIKAKKLFDKNIATSVVTSKENSNQVKETDFQKLLHQIHHKELWFPDPKAVLQILTGETKKSQDKTKDFLAICYGQVHGQVNSFAEYCEKAPEFMQGMEGKWVSVVRSNDGLYLLFSNIMITKINENLAENTTKNAIENIGTTNKYQVNLDNKFFGEGRIISGYFQCLLQDDRKILLLSFHLGTAKQPQLLQGTFSTVSTNGSPVAGLELLVRPKLLPKIAAPCKFELKDSEIWAKTEPNLQKIFENFEKCYLKVDTNKVYFEWTDL